MGNRTGEDVFDPGQQLVRTRSRAYDILNRLQQDLGSSAGRVTDYEYDAEGNRTANLQPLNRSIHQTYDALNRLADVVDPLGGTTHYSYDGQNRVIGLTDPSNQTTSYTRNGFGEVIQEVSADRGTTSYAYDEAGNLKIRTDARGLAVNYAYDALNRIVSIEAGDDQNKTYIWDNCNNGIGRLCQLTDFANTTEYQYDLHGRVVNKTQTVGSSTLSIAYAYDADGHLTSMTTPTGQTIGYGYANNRISDLSLNGQPLLTDIGYEPFGPVKSWTWSNGQSAYRGYDLDGRLTANDSGPTAAVNLTWDDADRLESASSGAEVQTFGYDDMDRVTDALGNWGQQTFAYDAVGNRLSKSEPSGLTQYGYGANNHRLDSQTGTVNRSYQYDAAGHLLNEGSLGFVYDNSGRLLGAHLSGTPISVYLHNALEQRVAKLTVNGPSVFVYDEAGRLIGDYSESRLTETIWLDDIPVALLKSQSNGSVALAGYIHTDHLGTPRKITDPSSNTLIWQWQGAPFGETAANDDPDGDGNHLAFNLRFPGQYYDTETGKHYNVHRNYDPALGRYIQSDPIGLAGGVNTYTYVRNNPIRYKDPKGLDVSYENTTAVGGLHQRVSVDTPDGQYGQSFGRTGDENDGSLAASSADGPTPDGNGQGMVYQDNRDPTTEVQDIIKTTPTQDAAIKSWLMQQLGNKDYYNPFFNSCRNYSSNTFDTIKEKLNNGDFGE
ncbi:RHS repeat-associated core domain-containing protein [Methylomonas rhizoryzae]|uniref:RHS repeat-associated core domain-containing protein n=1 Tax=Methylomonas rhizoryzae TaxID=2608981 RepID=UPI00123293FA|nr:RHS repeat-associated core domain-containing protein [Methylomonas rhizoryzae]